MRHTQKHSGFTLVELAIVLVIIGLIVGGVLVGQDLIKAAQIRSVVTDIERYNAAATTFRGKYGGLPGDLLNTKATLFGFNTANNDAARDGSDSHGDGDGKIEGCTKSNGASSVQIQNFGCENMLFWVDLSVAKMIPFGAKFTSVTATTPASRVENVDLGNGYLPKTKLNDKLLFFVSVVDGVSFDSGDGVVRDAGNRIAIANFFVDGASGAPTADFPSTTSTTNPFSYMGGLTPLEAVAIDTKLDDGKPLSGSVVNFESYINYSAWDNGECTIPGRNEYYTSDRAQADADFCPLSIRASF